MIVQPPRDPWRIVWRFVTGDGLLIVLLLGLAAGLTIAFWLPQMPAAGRVAYAQWFSEAQVRFGNATSAMRTLGLFSIARSFSFRALLALLAACLLLRLIESIDRLWQDRGMAEPAGEWQALASARLSDVVDGLRRNRYRILGESPLFQADRWPWSDLFPLSSHAGALLMLAGLLLAQLWGWNADGLIIQGGKQNTVPSTEAWVALDESARRVTHSPGVVAFVEAQVPGVQVSAADDTGRSLSLQQTAGSDLVPQLTLALTEERYFAIPQAQLVVRLASQTEAVVDSPVLVQVYRSPPGRLTTESVVEGDGELTVDDVTLALTGVPHARVTVAFNPGLWPAAVGLVLLIVGSLGSVVWPMRRLWLRGGDEQVEVGGDFSPLLAAGEEA